MSFHVVIPARYASQRLPGKPLASLAGRPLIEHVYERALESGARDVTIATDDERVASACRVVGADVVLTDEAHESGTDRIAEVAATKGWDDEDIVVNLQGDEPLMPPTLIGDAVRKLIETRAGIATLAAPITDNDELADPNAVKVVFDAHDQALYFTRAPIPHCRDTREKGKPLGWRHIGLYAYRVNTLKRLTRTPPCVLERTERLEQLRALWIGITIAIHVAASAPPPGVDTYDDLVRVESVLAQG